jgi:hypothetical protein
MDDATNRKKSPIDAMLDRVAWTCTLCGKAQKPVPCQCWTRCWCGWSYATEGGVCRNPVHRAATENRSVSNE